MNKRYRVLPYRQGSRSAKALAEALGGKVLKLEGSKFKPRVGQTSIFVNWGSTEYGPLHSMIAPEGAETEVFNSPLLTREASNKLKFFNLMKESCSDIIPRFWTNKEDIPTDENLVIVARSVLAGHSGEGITIHSHLSELPQVPLYVEYKKKKDEYRVHVGRQGEDVKVIAVQRKAKRTGAENVDFRVRNLANGFVFVREGVNPPPGVIEAAKRSLENVGLDFGAVDVIFNEHEGKAYVLEINTAPGLEGQTIQDYANFFRGVGA